MEEIRVLLVDDDRTVLEGLQMRLSLEPDIRVVGAAASGIEALEIASDVMPDVVVMDYEMPDQNGAVATKVLLAAKTPCRVVVLTIHEQSSVREASIAAGAAAFVSKHQAPETLIAAIRSAATPGVTGK